MASNLEDNRYDRQVAFEGIGLEGQANIEKSRVLQVGCGALGTNIASLLVRAGVGSLKIVDPDRVELSNLQRQTLFNESDAANERYKAEVAVEKLAEVNSQVKLSCYVGKFTQETISEFDPAEYDIILDATDDIVARFDINDYAVKNSLPWVYGAVAGSSGMAAFFPAGGKPCLNCVFDRPEKKTDVHTAQTKGVISPIVTMTTALQVSWTLKYLSGKEVVPSLAYYDIWSSQLSYSDIVSAGDKCPCCG